MENFTFAVPNKVYCTITTQESTVDLARLPTSIISDEQFLLIMFISLGINCQIIAVFGTIGNIINIMVFIKQGFSESMNVCLCALAVSDLFSLLFLIWSNLCYTPIFRDADIPWVTYEVQTVSGMWPHLIFTRITGWLTAFISFERCVCVLMPLKVKTIFTPQKHIVAVGTIFTVTLGCGSMAYFSLGLGWRFHSEKNATLIGLVYRMDEYQRKINDGIGYAVILVFMPVTCFVSVVICTGLLVVKLKQHAVWRFTNSSATNDKNQHVPKNNYIPSMKEQKVAKMVVLISVIFIASFLPAVGIFIAGFAEPQLNYDGLYKNLYLVTLSVSFTSEAINSSINIFVYIAISTKYRITLQSMFLQKRA